MEGQKCRICGCTDEDCSQCIRITGKPCHWVETDLCSACADAIAKSNQQNDMNFFEQLAAKGNVDITMRIMQKGDTLTINIMPGSPKSTNKPFNITGTGAELDAEFFNEVFPTVEKIKGLRSNKDEAVKDAEENKEEEEEKVSKRPAAKKSAPAKKTPDNKKNGKGKKPEKKKEEKPAVAEPNLFAAAEEPAADEVTNS